MSTHTVIAYRGKSVCALPLVLGATGARGRQSVHCIYRALLDVTIRIMIIFVARSLN